MRLTHVRITNYKSIEDSNEFTIGDVTCLVGKNEAGKTAILQALHTLNPESGTETFQAAKSYPRRFWSEYEEANEPAKVIETRWEIEEKEKAGLVALLGPKGLTGTSVTVSRSYDQKNTTWSTSVNEAEVASFLISNSSLHAEEKDDLSQHKSVEKIKATLTALGAQASERQKTLLQKLETSFKRGSGSTAVIDYLNLPKFFYFSSYDRMSGQVALEQLASKKLNKTLDKSDEVFLAFLSLVGTSLEDMAALNQFEPMIAKLEAVSNRISREIFTYWSQNRNLKVLFRLDAARSGDAPPFNSGNILRTRIENTIHQASVAFDERSTGFVWFFSFLVLFSQIKKIHGNNIILLLDEPGTSLHAKAQADLLRYFKEKLIPNHQVIYTTHSPFMVPADNLMAARTVEDVVKRDHQGQVDEILGTKVSENVLSVDRETLFPLQGALGYEITQTLFIGQHSVLVEGPSDLLYFQAYSAALQAAGRTSLSKRWTVVPAGGVDKVGAFMSLLYGNAVKTAVFTDFAKGQKKKIDDLKRSQLLHERNVLTAADFVPAEEADIEDLIGAEGYVRLVEATYGLAAPLSLADSSSRVVKAVEDAFRVLPATVPEFNHFTPSSYLISHPELLITLPGSAEALDRFENLFKQLNALLN